MRKGLSGLVLAALVSAAAPAGAHHSYAMFDRTTTLSVDGTLYAVEWKNPHSWVWVKVVDATGKNQLYGLEGGSPAALTRQGYTKASLKVGTKVQVRYNPLRDGRPGGNLVDIKFEAAPGKAG